MKVIVTGGAGFIGSHIVDELLANGHTPFVIDNLSSGTRRNLPADVSVYEIDIRDTEKLAAVFDEVRPHGVCHQAAQISVSRSMREPIVDAEINVMGTLNVFDQAARTGVERIVFASSGGALYGEVSGPVMEDCPTHPQSAYGISKWVAEQYLEFYSRQRQIKGIALRYSNVYGPRQNPHGEAGVVANFTKKNVVRRIGHDQWRWKIHSRLCLWSGCGTGQCPRSRKTNRQIIHCNQHWHGNWC